MLSVWRLQLLREVARRGTIAAAAAAVNLTPSAVSQQLAALEREVGTDLLERVGRTVRLTDAGWITVRHADAIASAIASAESELAGIRDVVTGDFRVAAIPTAARAVMPSVMTALSQTYPALRVSLRDYESPESLAALRLGEIDLAVVDEYDEPVVTAAAGPERHHLLADLTRVALPRDHHLAAGPLRLADLRDEYWIMDAEDSSFFRVAQRACRASGFEPRVRSHCRDYAVIIALVEAGLGVAILPGLALHDRRVRALVRPTDPPLVRHLVAVVNPERRAHPAVAATLAELRRFGEQYVQPS